MRRRLGGLVGGSRDGTISSHGWTVCGTRDIMGQKQTGVYSIRKPVILTLFLSLPCVP